MMLLKIVGSRRTGDRMASQERTSDQACTAAAAAHKKIYVFLLKLHIFLHMKRVMIASHLVIYYTDRILVVLQSASECSLSHVHLRCSVCCHAKHSLDARAFETHKFRESLFILSSTIFFVSLCCRSFLLKLWWCRYFRFFSPTHLTVYHRYCVYFFIFVSSKFSIHRQIR